jgi:hypothetical protein
MIDRTALPESALAHLIRSHYSKYETAQPLNRSTAQPLNRSTAQPLNRSTAQPLDDHAAG